MFWITYNTIGANLVVGLHKSFSKEEKQRVKRQKNVGDRSVYQHKSEVENIKLDVENVYFYF